MIFALLGLVIACVLIGVGIVLGLVAVAIAAGLLAAGVLSSSVLVGLKRGRVQAGWRAFFLQCGILAGIPAGMVCAWLGTSIWAQMDHALVMTLAVGGAAGALGGAVIALFFDLIATRAHTWLSARLDRARTPALPAGSRVV